MFDVFKQKTKSQLQLLQTPGHQIACVTSAESTCNTHTTDISSVQFSHSVDSTSLFLYKYLTFCLYVKMLAYHRNSGWPSESSDDSSACTFSVFVLFFSLIFTVWYHRKCFFVQRNVFYTTYARITPNIMTTRYFEYIGACLFKVFFGRKKFTLDFQIWKKSVQSSFWFFGQFCV